MHYTDKEELEDWASKYETAVADGVFGDSEGDYKPTPKTSEESFFGVQNTHPTDQAVDSDAAYWKNICARTEDPNYRLDSKGELLQERFGHEKFDLHDGIEAKQGDIAKAVKIAAGAANPIALHSMGPDQEIGHAQMSLTFTPEDVENLAQLKYKLHELTSELNSFEGRGKNAKKFETQISSLKKKIDELSTTMTQVLPFSLSGASD